MVNQLSGELKKRISQYFDEHVAGISVKEEWAEGYNFDIANIIDEAKKDMALGAHIIAPPQLAPNKYICININDWKTWFGESL